MFFIMEPVGVSSKFPKFIVVLVLIAFFDQFFHVTLAHLQKQKSSHVSTEHLDLFILLYTNINTHLYYGTDALRSQASYILPTRR